MIKNKKFLFIASFLFCFFIFMGILRASVINGTIDGTNKYAYSENIGWINFSDLNSVIHITDTELTGYAYGENAGWISLNCSNTDTCSTNNYKVSNTESGVLSGYAYGENIGWVNFSGVTINNSGELIGYAYNENTGYISFSCSNTDTCSTNNYKVTTDWRPFSQRPICNNGVDDDSDGYTDYPSDNGCSSLDDVTETFPSGSAIPPQILESMNNQNQSNQNQEEDNNEEEGQNNNKDNESSNNNLNFWTDGRFIKLENDDTIYFVDKDNIKHEYPDTHTWDSYFKDDFSKVEIVSKKELDNYLTGDNVPHKINSLIKTTDNPRVYQVTDNKTIRWIINEDVATRLFGKIWNKIIYDISNLFFKDYKIGEDIE